MGSVKGVKKWIQESAENMIDKEKLEQETNEFMFNYDTKKLEYQKRLETLSSAPDSDGWITVTKGKKAAGGIGVANKLNRESLNKLIAKEKQKQKADFYRFQRTAQTNTHIQELRKRFEEDKKRIEKLKQGRKFRPF